jgi:hypothetical protein
MDTIPALTREELLALNQKFREVKHDINNTLAVFMAQAEMAKLKPEYQEKLLKAVLTRGPQIVHQLQEFQKAMTERIAATAPAEQPV